MNAQMSAHEKTVPAVAVCLTLIVAAFVLFVQLFEWPTSRIVRAGFSITEQDIWVRDVLPIVLAGYFIGLAAMAVTRLLFPRSSIKAVLYVVGAFAGVVALFVLYLSIAIGGKPAIRDLGAIAMLIMAPLGGATWAALARRRQPS
jgi:hypothetical protein